MLGRDRAPLVRVAGWGCLPFCDRV